jgi:uncharacterized protein YegP (UPF0339 family)
VFRFRLKATNGQVIATGEGYKTKASAIKGIESVQKNAPEAKIEDLSGVSSASGGGVLPMNGWPVVIGFVDGAVVGVCMGLRRSTAAPSPIVRGGAQISRNGCGS